MAESIVRGSFPGFFQHFIGFFSLFELGFSTGIVLVAVRVMLHCQATIGLLDLDVSCRFRDAKNLVIVAFCHTLFLSFGRRAGARDY